MNNSNSQKLKLLAKEFIFPSLRVAAFFIGLFLIAIMLLKKDTSATLISPLPDSGLLTRIFQPLQQIPTKQYEVFGFAPHWSLHKMDNVDFNALTTLAYFGIAVKADGEFKTDDPGYLKFNSQSATDLFQKAHDHNTKVVLTLTQMDNKTIKKFLDDAEAQEKAVRNSVQIVKQRNIEGVNIDFEYLGDPGYGYSQKFADFVGKMSSAMRDHGFTISTSVYAASAKEEKMYDIDRLAAYSDKIFMMAYDYATTSADNAIPTAPLFGHSEGKYWYDVSSAVDDFLAKMPAEKLIMGTPWYGYNLLVYEPTINSETRPRYSWRGQPKTQTYEQIQETITPDMPGISNFKEGWDDLGKSRYRAYHVKSTNTWRIVFYDDPESLRIKYDYAKEKKLGGVGMWALGFDGNRRDLWEVVAEKFGGKNDDLSLSNKLISRN